MASVAKNNTGKDRRGNLFGILGSTFGLIVCGAIGAVGGIAVMIGYNAFADTLSAPADGLVGLFGILFAILITLFGVLITGIFVFMTFRIDRGASIEAREAATEVAKKETKNLTTEEIKETIIDIIDEAISKNIHPEKEEVKAGNE